MKIFLDTVDLNAIKKYSELGLIDGVTTNPTLLARNKYKDVKTLLCEICEVMKGKDVSIEVVEKDPEKVYESAREIAKIADNVVVKVPCLEEYYSVIKKLVDDGVKINVTLVFTVLQALMMAKLNVKYVSIFVGRLGDVGVDGVMVVEEVKDMFLNYGFDTKVLAASIRSVEHVKQVALCYTDIVTVPVSVFEKLVEHPLSVKGVENFLSDWSKSDLVF